jgi:DNA-binding CsgD family transcriptional regulator
MPLLNSSLPPLPERRLSAAAAESLLQHVARIGDEHESLSDRRRAALQAVCKVLDAECGFWAWGLGQPGLAQPDLGTVSPVVAILHGYSDEQANLFYQNALDPALQGRWHFEFIAGLRGATTGALSRRELISDQEWSNHPLRRLGQAMGTNSWIHALRYATEDAWSNLWIARRVGRDEFTPDDTAVVELAIRGIPWLQAHGGQSVTSHDLAGLTPRQRTVMFMLLEGHTRKAIASRLEIAEETVGDHLKSVYRHFKVKSAQELAAVFLRSK